MFKCFYQSKICAERIFVFSSVTKNCGKEVKKAPFFQMNAILKLVSRIKTIIFLKKKII